jgi:hypothetical protein
MDLSLTIPQTDIAGISEKSSVNDSPELLQQPIDPKAEKRLLLKLDLVILPLFTLVCKSLQHYMEYSELVLINHRLL